MNIKIGDGSTGIHWRQTEDDRFFIDFRLKPKRYPIGSQADVDESVKPDLSIEFTNHRSIGVMIWALSEILQRMEGEKLP